MGRAGVPCAGEAAGVPEITPVLLLKESPGGSEPETMLHV